MTNDEREPLTRERILAAAIELADEHGVDGLSMRKLASQLGYEVMSLYNHIANKDDLLDGMVDVVASEIVQPADCGNWKAAVREVAMSAHKALVGHRWASALWSRRWPGRHRWQYMETLLQLLNDANLPDDIADLGFHAVTTHIQGFTQQQISYSTQVPDEAAMFARFQREVSPGEFPAVVDHVRYHRETILRHDEFAFVLDLILDGLERTAGDG